MTHPRQQLGDSKLARTHITLNPYSTQLVENLNLLMPGKSTNSNISTLKPEQFQRASVAMEGNTRLANLTNSLRKGEPNVYKLMEHKFDKENFIIAVTNTVPNQRFEVNPTISSPHEIIYRAVSPHGHVYWEIGQTTQVRFDIGCNCGQVVIASGWES